ncbi:MAG: hypothetical protein M1820_004641 [Bogoriella megaspora]|nr:MAG: hypothetical protein M1820_004641 [Bogoriella megaspora]
MPLRTVAAAKFIGTISLGLLTGLSYTNATLLTPALLTLPSAATASRTFTTLRNASTLHAQALTATSCISLFLAYAISPSKGRHPYLIWVSFITGLGSSAVDYFLMKGEKQAKEKDSAKARISDEDSEDYDREEEDAVNGEQVRGQVERFRVAEAWRAGVSGLAFLMGVVGIWGDAY